MQKKRNSSRKKVLLSFWQRNEKNKLCGTRILTQQLKWITEIISCAAYSEGLGRIILDYGHWPDLVTDCLLCQTCDSSLRWLASESHISRNEEPDAIKCQVFFLSFFFFEESQLVGVEWACTQDYKMERSIFKHVCSKTMLITSISKQLLAAGWN